ncbi:MAG: dihydroorotate dehydrogenase [Clostridia bacterium]
MLNTDLIGFKLKNPVIAASGTFGFGSEYARFFNPSRLGGICGKGLTLNGSKGNAGIRVYETSSGMMNSIGLENPGIFSFIEKESKIMRSYDTCSIANLGGHSESDYITGATLLNDADIDIIELNISCPNVKSGGMAFGTTPESAFDIVKKVRTVTDKPLMVKLSPNALDIVAVALASQEAGADALSLVNTFLGMAIDVNRRKPIFNNIYAGLSGPAIKPIALRMVHSVCKRVNIPVVGIGGIQSASDALEFIMAGAVAVQVGSSTFPDPFTMIKIIDGLTAYCVNNKLNNISEIRGII